MTHAPTKALQQAAQEGDHTLLDRMSELLNLSEATRRTGSS
ncbi:MAG: hypothetical protein R3E89_18105 [Thiolinea sp.]